MKNWHDMTIKELKYELKNNNLPHTGNKAQLIKRLEGEIFTDAEIVEDKKNKYHIMNFITDKYNYTKSIQFTTLSIIVIVIIGMSGGALLNSDRILDIIGGEEDYILIDFDINQSREYAQTLVNLGHPDWGGRLSGTIEEKNTAESIKYNFSEMNIPSTIEEFEVPMFEMGNQFELSLCTPGDIGGILAGPTPCSIADVNRDIIEFTHTEDYVIQGYSGSMDVRYASETNVIDLGVGSADKNWGTASQGIGLVWLRDSINNESATENNTVLFLRAQENQLSGLILINDKTNCGELIENDCVPYFKSLNVESFSNLPESIGFLMASKSIGEYIVNEVVNGNSRIQMIVDVQNQGTGTIYVPCGIIQGKTDKLIIFGAHHDTVYNGQGAIDNTAGAATLQEISRQFSEILNEHGEPEYTLWFCTWGGEEEGLLGSSEWVKKHQNRLEKDLRLYINLDMNHVDLERNNGVTLFGNNNNDISHINKIVKTFRDEYSNLYDKYKINVMLLDSEEMPKNSDHAPFVYEISEDKFGNSLVCYGSGSSEYHTYLDTMDRFNEESLALSGIIYGSFVRYLSYN
ncbi:MAG: M28 family peptidase [Candidatus Thalassarchaeaceae archaeon]|nr:M28 family peptidase [Candidatus Thalassarchaeaceae archaeon]